jgi:hypothetical protein
MMKQKIFSSLLVINFNFSEKGWKNDCKNSKGNGFMGNAGDFGVYASGLIG